MTDWVTFILSLVGAAVTAFVTARFTVKGLQEQAIKTEYMKLRYEILRRRVEQFDHAVLAFKDMAFEREDRREARDVGMSPPAAVLLRHRAVAVNLHAGLVCGPDVERQERLKPARERFGESAQELAALEFEMGHTSDPGAWKTYPKKFLDVRVRVEKTLTLLQETVDKLAEDRIGEPT